MNTSLDSHETKQGLVEYHVGQYYISFTDTCFEQISKKFGIKGMDPKKIRIQRVWFDESRKKNERIGVAFYHNLTKPGCIRHDYVSIDGIRGLEYDPDEGFRVTGEPLLIDDNRTGDVISAVANMVQCKFI